MRSVIACLVALVLISPVSFAPPPARAASSELFFSEYVEGSSNNKALEIYNGTGAAVDLAANRYNVQMFFNGSSTAGTTIFLTGTVASGDVFVLVQTFAAPALRAQADQTSSASWYNGDDAVVLRKDTTVIDVIGQVGVDPGTEWGTGPASTADNTIRRKAGVEVGDTDGSDPFDPTAEWDGFANNTFDGIGIHPGVAAEPPTLPIGTVQGAVSSTADGRAHRSPYAAPSGGNAGQTVRVQGVVYQKTLAKTSSGGVTHGVFIQNTAATADADPTTSDGIFVFMGNFPDFLREEGGANYVPQVGDELVLAGHVTEFFNLTELAGPFLRLVRVVRTGVDVASEVRPQDVRPPDVLADAHRYWERLEGMRALIPADSIVTGARDVFASTMDGELWVIRPDHPVATRAGAFNRRVFRDPHPLDDIAGELFDNGNGYRIVLGSLGIKANLNDRDALIAPARTFDRFRTQAVGGVYFSFSKYQIMVDRQIALRPGPSPEGISPVREYERTTDARIVTFNLENLYDFRDDPTDGCDFTGNLGCPGVRPPFDYVPESQAAYGRKVSEQARQILNDLHAPDIVMVQEIEDQDFCNQQAGGLACSGADGQPDVLQDLAIEIARLGGPAYRAATDRDGADDRGIINAFLYRADRVELASVDASHPVLGSSPAVVYPEPGLGYNADVENPKVLNAALPADAIPGADGTNVFTRPPQVALFRILGSPAPVQLYLLNNHFSSTPTGRVAQRKEQAIYNAAIIVALQRREPQVYAVVGGDLNVYPRPDDPSAPGELPAFSDQLKGLYDAGLLNLWEVLVARDAAGAYSYVFEGQVQTLDQLFVTPSLRARLARMGAAHINSDWPVDFDGDGPRGTSDHDPQVAEFRFFAPGP